MNKIISKKCDFPDETEKKTYFNFSRIGLTGYNRKAEKPLKKICIISNIGMDVILSKSVLSQRSSSILKIINCKILENEKHSDLYIIQSVSGEPS